MPHSSTPVYAIYVKQLPDGQWPPLHCTPYSPIATPASTLSHTNVHATCSASAYEKCRGAHCASAYAIYVKQLSDGQWPPLHCTPYSPIATPASTLSHTNVHATCSAPAYEKCRGAHCASAYAIYVKQLSDGQWPPLHGSPYVPCRSYFHTSQYIDDLCFNYSIDHLCMSTHNISIIYWGKIKA